MTAPGNRSAQLPPRDQHLTEEATAWFVRINSGGASRADRDAFRRWLEGDPAHRAAYAEAEALWGELGAIPDPRAGSGVEREIRPGRGGRGRWYGALAASVLLAAALGLWAAGVDDDLRADHATAVGETRTVALADGSRIQLDTDTAIAVDFADGRRRVRLLRGDAFFTVAADPDRPFEVAAGDGIARAIGTRFEVRSVGSAVTVAVEKGRVRVLRNASRQSSAGSVTLGPGEAARYDAEGLAGYRVDPTGLAAWREGKLVFADRPLRAVVAELDRYRPGAIVFLDSAVADARFTGVLTLRDTDQALAAIAETLPVDVVRLTRYVTLLRAREG